jgi:eukaryotic-like serine/threonine-protein kinase
MEGRTVAGCAAPQLRPIPEDCPQEVVQRMKEMQLFDKGSCGEGCLDIDLDINQPGTEEEEKKSEGEGRYKGGIGVYHAGKLVSRVYRRRGHFAFEENSPVPEGTRLIGQMWTEKCSCRTGTASRCATPSGLPVTW